MPNEQNKQFNKLVLHPSFMQTIEEINKIHLTLKDPPKHGSFDFSSITFAANPSFGSIGDIEKISLNAQNGASKFETYNVAGYDESKLNYDSLEGNAFFTAHSLVLLDENEYIPINYLSFYFYTRSSKLSSENPALTLSEDSAIESNYHYVTDRNKLLLDYPFNGAIYFIDGPLIGGNISSYTVNLVRELHKFEIIPIFFVKNSESELVIENVPELSSDYNSDMHWSYNFLNVGQRTNFFTYIDQKNQNNAKVFCYLKAFDRSPQRIEFHLETYEMIKEKINDLMDIVYYLILVHGDKTNPQIRPIAIAEKYARDILKLSDSYNLIKFSGLVPTMNQLRFGN